MNPEKDIKGFENQQGKFKVPADYFSALEKDVLQRIADENVEIPGASLDVPQGYFDQLPENILNRIRTEKKSRIIRLSTWLSVAASLALVVTLYYIIPEKECETFTCMLEKTEFETEELLFIDEEIIAEYYLELTSETEAPESGEMADTSKTIITDQLEEELLESLDEEDFFEDIDF
jgi:hypothetical protein